MSATLREDSGGAATAGERRYLTWAEATDYLRISNTSLRRLVDAGALKPARPSPGRRVFDRLQLDRYMAASVVAEA